MSGQLKPCPFCGGTKIDGGYNEHGGFVSICANCDTYGPPAAEMSKDAIIDAWNRRADAPELVALVEAAISADNFMRGDKAYERSGYGPKLRAALAAWEALK